MNKMSVGVVVARSKRLWKDQDDSHSPQPNRDGREQRSAISHYGVVSQGELDGDKTFNADQREMKNNDSGECEAERCLYLANTLQHLDITRA